MPCLESSWTIERFAYGIENGIFVLYDKLVLKIAFAEAQAVPKL